MALKRALQPLGAPAWRCTFRLSREPTARSCGALEDRRIMRPASPVWSLEIQRIGGFTASRWAAPCSRRPTKPPYPNAAITPYPKRCHEVVAGGPAKRGPWAGFRVVGAARFELGPFGPSR